MFFFFLPQRLYKNSNRSRIKYCIEFLVFNHSNLADSSRFSHTPGSIRQNRKGKNNSYHLYNILYTQKKYSEPTDLIVRPSKGLISTPRDNV